MAFYTISTYLFLSELDKYHRYQLGNTQEAAASQELSSQSDVNVGRK
jgi:hypothetical protein